MSSTQASRPDIPVSYGVPASTEGMLSWSYVTQRLEKARNYWIATTRPDGRPHVVPVWGIWNDDAFYFGGEPTTRWVRNILTNPFVALHLEDGEQVVIVEGKVEKCVPDSGLAVRLARASAEKYAVTSDSPDSSEVAEDTLCLRPQIVLAWTHFPEDATRWRFAG